MSHATMASNDSSGIGKAVASPGVLPERSGGVPVLGRPGPAPAESVPEGPLPWIDFENVRGGRTILREGRAGTFWRPGRVPALLVLLPSDRAGVEVGSLRRARTAVRASAGCDAGLTGAISCDGGGGGSARSV